MQRGVKIGTSAGANALSVFGESFGKFHVCRLSESPQGGAFVTSPVHPTAARPGQLRTGLPRKATRPSSHGHL